MKNIRRLIGGFFIKMGENLIKTPREEREQWTKRSELLDEKLDDIYKEACNLEEYLDSATRAASSARNQLIEEWQEYEEVPNEWKNLVACCTETIESLRQEIMNGDISTLKKEQNSFLRSRKNSLSSITKSLESLTQQIKEQRIAPRNKYEQLSDKLDNNLKPIDETVQILKYLIEDTRDVILVAQANNISWEFSQAYRKIQGRIKWLWGFIFALMTSAVVLLIFAVRTMPANIDIISLISFFTSRLGVLIVIVIPYTLLRRTIISSEEEAKLYKYKETLITTFIAFRDRIAKDDDEVRESITRGMIQAVITPPQGISLPTLSDFLIGLKSLKDEETDELADN